MSVDLGIKLDILPGDSKSSVDTMKDLLKALQDIKLAVSGIDFSKLTSGATSLKATLDTMGRGANLDGFANSAKGALANIDGETKKTLAGIKTLREEMGKGFEVKVKVDTSAQLATIRSEYRAVAEEMAKVKSDIISKQSTIDLARTASQPNSSTFPYSGVSAIRNRLNSWESQDRPKQPQLLEWAKSIAEAIDVPVPKKKSVEGLRSFILDHITEHEKIITVTELKLSGLKRAAEDLKAKHASLGTTLSELSTKTLQSPQLLNGQGPLAPKTLPGGLAANLAYTTQASPIAQVASQISQAASKNLQETNVAAQKTVKLMEELAGFLGNNEKLKGEKLERIKKIFQELAPVLRENEAAVKPLVDRLNDLKQMETVLKGLDKYGKNADAASIRASLDTQNAISAAQKKNEIDSLFRSVSGAVRGSDTLKFSSDSVTNLRKITKDDLIDPLLFTQVKGQVAEVKAALKDIAPVNVSNPFKAMFKDLEVGKTSVDQLNQAMQKFIAEGGKVTTGNVAGLTSALGAHKAKWDEATQSVRTNTKEVSAWSKIFGESIGKMAARLTEFYSLRTAIFAIGGEFRDTVTAAFRFSQNIHDIAAIAGSTKKEMNELGESILGIAQRSRFTSDEVAKLVQLLAQAGVSANDLPEVAEATGRFATATGAKPEQAADLVTTSLNIYDKKASETASVTNVLTAALNESKLTVDGLATAMNYLAPTAEQLGMELEQTAGIIATMAQAGIKSSTIGTGTSQLLKELSAPKGRFKELLNYYKIDEETINPLKNSYAEIISVFENATGKLGEQGVQVQHIMRALETRTGRSLITSMSLGSEAFERMTTAVTGTNATWVAYIKSMEGAEAKMNVLKQTFQAALISNLSVIGPLFKWVVEITTSFIKAMETTPGKLLLAGAALTGLAGALALASGAMTTFATTTTGAAVAASFFGRVLTAHPILLALSAAALVAGAAFSRWADDTNTAVKANEKFNESMGRTMETLDKSAQGIRNAKMINSDGKEVYALSEYNKIVKKYGENSREVDRIKQDGLKVTDDTLLSLVKLKESYPVLLKNLDIENGRVKNLAENWAKVVEARGLANKSVKDEYNSRTGKDLEKEAANYDKYSKVREVLEQKIKEGKGSKLDEINLWGINRSLRAAGKNLDELENSAKVNKDTLDPEYAQKTIMVGKGKDARYVRVGYGAATAKSPKVDPDLVDPIASKFGAGASGSQTAKESIPTLTSDYDELEVRKKEREKILKTIKQDKTTAAEVEANYKDLAGIEARIQELSLQRYVDDTKKKSAYDDEGTLRFIPGFTEKYREMFKNNKDFLKFKEDFVNKKPETDGLIKDLTDGDRNREDIQYYAFLQKQNSDRAQEEKEINRITSEEVKAAKEEAARKASEAYTAYIEKLTADETKRLRDIDQAALNTMLGSAYTSASDRETLVTAAKLLARQEAITKYVEGVEALEKQKEELLRKNPSDTTAVPKYEAGLKQLDQNYNNTVNEANINIDKTARQGSAGAIDLKLEKTKSTLERKKEKTWTVDEDRAIDIQALEAEIAATKEKIGLERGVEQGLQITLSTAGKLEDVEQQRLAAAKEATVKLTEEQEKLQRQLDKLKDTNYWGSFTDGVKDAWKGLSDTYALTKQLGASITNTAFNGTVGAITSGLNAAFNPDKQKIADIKGEITQLNTQKAQLQQDINTIDANTSKTPEEIKNLNDKKVALAGINEELAKQEQALKKETDGWKNFADGMKDVMNKILEELQRYVIQLLVVAAVKQVAGFMGFSDGGVVSAGVNSGKGTGSGIPKAAFGSAGQLKFADGGVVDGLSGGYIPMSMGTPGKDSVRAWLMPGEVVIQKSSVDYYGADKLLDINDKKAPRFAEGGFVGNRGASSTASTKQDMTLQIVNITQNDPVPNAGENSQQIINVINGDIAKKGPTFRTIKAALGA